MARPGHPAWLLLLLLLLVPLLATGAAAQACLSATFQGGRTFLRCNPLPVLSASLHWTYHAENGTADIAFRAQSPADGWVAWGINPDSTGMAGSNVFVASQGGGGAVSVLTTVLATTAPTLDNTTLKFDVPVPASAEYAAGAYTIYATVVLPRKSARQNTVWQAGPTSGGSILPHPRDGANLKSVLTVDFNTEKQADAPSQSSGAANSRLQRPSLHGVLNAVGGGILIALGAMIA